MRAVQALLWLSLLLGCESPRTQYEREKREAWHGPCADVSTLLATTAGSPNGFTCPNKRHQMRVEVASTGTPEEAAALVFCECRRTP